MSVTNSMFINDLPLPASLVKAIESGIWQTPSNSNVWRALFPENEIVRPTLYPLQELQGKKPWLSDAGPMFYGTTGEGFVPGDIDPTRAILIADLGPERLIALDYRTSETQPSVVALTSDEHSNWVRIADDIESFMRAIGLISV